MNTNSDELIFMNESDMDHFIAYMRNPQILQNCLIIPNQEEDVMEIEQVQGGNNTFSENAIFSENMDWKLSAEPTPDSSINSEVLIDIFEHTDDMMTDEEITDQVITNMKYLPCDDTVHKPIGNLDFSTLNEDAEVPLKEFNIYELDLQPVDEDYLWCQIEIDITTPLSSPYPRICIAD